MAISGYLLRVFCYSIVDWCFLSRAVFFFFQAEDGIRDLVRSRGLGDVYKRQHTDYGQSLRIPGGEERRPQRQDRL